MVDWMRWVAVDRAAVEELSRLGVSVPYREVSTQTVEVLESDAPIFRRLAKLEAVVEVVKKARPALDVNFNYWSWSDADALEEAARSFDVALAALEGDP